MSDTRTEAAIAVVTEALRKRRLQIDPPGTGSALASIQLRIDFDDAGGISGLTYSQTERDRHRVKVGGD